MTMVQWPLGHLLLSTGRRQARPGAVARSGARKRGARAAARWAGAQGGRTRDYAAAKAVAREGQQRGRWRGASRRRAWPAQARAGPGERAGAREDAATRQDKNARPQVEHSWAGRPARSEGGARPGEREGGAGDRLARAAGRRARGARQFGGPGYL